MFSAFCSGTSKGTASVGSAHSAPGHS
jgi:hypothetical protein